MISPFEHTLRALSDASRHYEHDLARFALGAQRAAKRDAAHIVTSAERLIRRTHAQLRSTSVAIRRRRRRRARRRLAQSPPPPPPPPAPPQRRQSSLSIQPPLRDRRSTATVESYDTANADFSAARAAPDADAAASPADRAPAQSLRSPQLDRGAQSPSAESDAVASSAREQSPCPSPQHVPLQHEDRTNTPEQEQQMHQAPQSTPNQSTVHNKLSASLQSEPDRSRSSAHTASSFESDAPADDSDHESGNKSAEQQLHAQPDIVPLSPHSDSRTERQASNSPQPQSDSKHLEERTERSPDTKTESNADDALPESIQQSPVPASSPQLQQPPTPADEVLVDHESESVLVNDIEHHEPRCESREPSLDSRVKARSNQARGEAADATLAKEVNSSSSDIRPVAERDSGSSETPQVSTESSASPEVLPDVSSSMPAPKQVPPSQIPRKPSRIIVDNAGKIDHSSLSALSRIIGTKSVDKTMTDTETNKSTHKLTTPRTTKLFKPNNNIYSLQQTGNTSPVQRFSSSNRSSILSHTPGAEAPVRRHSPAVSRHQRLESLNKQLESFQNSNGAGLQGPERQMAELRHGRTGAQVLGDLGDPKVSQYAKDGENIFRSVRERTLKVAETHVKDASKVDIWSMRAKGAKTTPARDKLRARERSKSKSAFRSQLQEIMTGKACSAEDDEDEEDKGESIGSRLLETSRNDDSMVEPRIQDKVDEEKLSRTLSKDGDRSKSIVISPEVVQPSAVETHSLLAETRDACLEADNAGKRDELISNLPAASSSASPEEEQNASVLNVGKPDIEKAPATSAPLTNLMTSIVSFLPGSSSLLGTRPTREQSEESEAEAAAKRQKLDMERREAEVQARREAQRLLRQKETEEKQRRAEKRRLLLARADKEKEEEKRKKEERRLRKKLEEEEARKRKKQEDDRKKEERRRLVLEKKAQNEMKLKRKKKGAEPLPPRKVPKGISGKSWVSGQGASLTPDAHFQGHEKSRLSGTPSTPVTKKTDASHGQSNYDMTPAQETVFELSDEEEERRKHKRIPQWAQGPKLSTAARDQPDPDDVFVNVPTCDLREVFGNVRRFRPRSSSANWTKDRVTAQEMVKFRKGQAAFNEPPQ
ncbi:hypothetical protein FGB62_235g013 [Gracilaria domingensis]|nr:hypothetical protein FGB62_235g013 [Gracilaria domingensis]